MLLGSFWWDNNDYYDRNSWSKLRATTSRTRGTWRSRMEVECIVGHRKRGRGHQYHVLWKGYPITEAMWEPETVFEHVQEMLLPYKEYHGLYTKIWTPQCLSNKFYLSCYSNFDTTTPETCWHPHVSSTYSQHPFVSQTQWPDDNGHEVCEGNRRPYKPSRRDAGGFL